jgi:flagellar biosynthesis/type III secretory pathway protein FliH
MSISNDDNKKFIEETIEKKINQFIQEVPNFKRDIKKEIEVENDFFNFSIIDTYQNMMQTIIDIINDIIKVYDDNDKIFKNILIIFFNENRLFYIGIILIILSFVIYFIDGATI